MIWVWPNVTESSELYDQLLAAGMDGLNANLPAEAVAATQRLVAAS